MPTPVTIVSCPGTAYMPSRCIVRLGSYWWAFYMRTSDGYLCYKSSTDGTSWGNEGVASHAAISNNNGLGAYTDGSYIYVAYSTGTYSTGSSTASTAYTRKGSPSGTSISWNTQVSVRQGGGYWQFFFSYTTDWILFGLVGYWTTSQVYHGHIWRSTDGESWTEIMDYSTGTGNRPGFQFSYWPEYTNGVLAIRGRRNDTLWYWNSYNGSSWSGWTSFSSKTSASYVSRAATLVTENDEVHFTRVPDNNGGTIYYRYFITSWSSEVSIDTGGTNVFPCLCAHSEKLYLFFIRGTALYKKEMTYATHSWTTAVSWVSGETSPFGLPAEMYPPGNVGVVWRAQAAAPFNMRFEKEVTGIPPIEKDETLDFDEAIAKFIHKVLVPA